MNNETDIIVGCYYINYQGYPKYKIISIENDRVTFETLHSGNVSSKTLSWARKYMKYDNEANKEL